MERKKDIKHFRDLEVYQFAFHAAMKIFEMTKSFPADERYFYHVKYTFEISL